MSENYLRRSRTGLLYSNAAGIIGTLDENGLHRGGKMYV